MAIAVVVGRVRAALTELFEVYEQALAAEAADREVVVARLHAAADDGADDPRPNGEES